MKVQHNLVRIMYVGQDNLPMIASIKSIII